MYKEKIYSTKQTGIFINNTKHLRREEVFEYEVSVNRPTYYKRVHLRSSK